MGGISRMAKHELLATIRDRYRRSSKGDKGRILDEFIAVTGLPAQPVATGGSPAHPQGPSALASPLAYPEGSLRRRLARRAFVASKRPRYQRQGFADKITRGLSGPVRRCSTANAAAQSEGLVGVMAKALIYAASDEPASEPSEKVELGLEIKARISVTFSGEAIRRQS